MGEIHISGMEAEDGSSRRGAVSGSLSSGLDLSSISVRGLASALSILMCPSGRCCRSRPWSPPSSACCTACRRSGSRVMPIRPHSGNFRVQGTRVTSRPPHGSVRAQLGHTACMGFLCQGGVTPFCVVLCIPFFCSTPRREAFFRPDRHIGHRRRAQRR